MNPFCPHVDLTNGHASAALSVSGTSQRVELPNCPDFLVTATASMWIRFGDANATAQGSAPGDIYVPGGGSMVMRKPGGQDGACTHVAAIGAGVLHIVGGVGL